MEGVDVNTQVTNWGEIRVTADRGIGMAGIGNGHEVSNFGLIEMHGTFTIGMVARGSVSPPDPVPLPGLELEMVNAGRITTEGDLAIGAALGVSRGDSVPLRAARSSIAARSKPKATAPRKSS